MAAKISIFRRALAAVGFTGAPKTLADLNALDYRKEWDTSGSAMVLREWWTDSAGNVQREVVHDYAVDMAAAEKAGQQ